ncbi:hypothetical protein [Spirosoma knui]
MNSIAYLVSITLIVITELGKRVYRFGVPTNASKQIIARKGVCFNKANYPDSQDE